MAVEASEIEAVKEYLEGILKDQGQQIKQLQLRMEEENKRHRTVEDQLRKERQEWKEKEKTFNKKIRILQQKLGQGRKETCEDDLIEKLEKDVEEKDRLIKSLMKMLRDERSKTKELEEKKQIGLCSSSEEESSLKVRQPKDTEAVNSENVGNRNSQDNGDGLQMPESIYEALADLFKSDDNEGMNEVLDLSNTSTSELGSAADDVCFTGRKATYDQCCHCKRILRDVVALKCGHQFCVRCGQNMLTTETESKCSCSSCQLQFVLPKEVGGKDQLDIEKMSLSTKQLVRKLSLSRVVCEVCLSEEYAVYFCLLCCEKLCIKCSTQHINQSSKSLIHLLVNIERPIVLNGSSEDELCGKHRDCSFQSYCLTCQDLICTECLVDHSGHSTSTIIEKSSSLNEEISQTISNVDKIVSSLTSASFGFRNLQETSLQRTEQMKEDIQLKALMTRVWLDDQEMRLERELNYLSEINRSRLDCLRSDAETVVDDMKRFRIHAEEFLHETKPLDLFYFGNDFKTRIKELEKLGNDKLSDLERIGVHRDGRFTNPIAISFVPFDARTFMLQSGVKNAIGVLSTKSLETTTSNTRLYHSFQPKLLDRNGEKEVCGLTILENELFIAIRNSSSIEVFDLDTCQHKRQMIGLNDVSDLASCADVNCLFVCCDDASSGSKGISLVELNGEIRRSWPVHYESARISLTAGTCVVTGCNTNRLSEYSCTGHPMHRIALDACTNILHLWHAVRFDDRRFVVSHGIDCDAVHGVCVVDSDGRLLRSYEGPRDVLDIPMHLALGDQRSLFVADLNNMRILRLNSILELTEELISSKDCGLKWPHRMHFDFARRRLFVASSDFLETWKVFVFDVK